MRLIEKVWFKSHQAKWLLVPLLFPLTLLFAAISAVRRFCFKYNVLPTYRVKQPVIIVGNIGVGGNGKTPVVVLLIKLCRELGLNPGVISRGYGGTIKETPYLLNDSTTAEQAGDEPVLIYNRCSVPVVIGADRVASAKLLIQQGCNIILADDGLQHYRLQRDLELVIIDGKRKFGNGLLLPAGPLREGVWRLSTADIVIVNGGEPQEVITNNQLSMTLNASHVCHLLTGELTPIAEFIHESSTVNAIAGIGSPERFFNTLEQQQFSLNESLGFVDHHHFTLADFAHFNDKLPLLMTEKDAVKCKPFAKDNWWYLPVKAEIATTELAYLKEKITDLTQ